MKMSSVIGVILFLTLSLSGCNKSSGEPIPVATVETVAFNGQTVSNGGQLPDFSIREPTVSITFSEKIDKGKFDYGKIALSQIDASSLEITQEGTEKQLIIKIKQNLNAFSAYQFTILAGEQLGITLENHFSCKLITGIDPAPKFPQITDDELLTKVQQQTFKYFWDFAEPHSGMAPERTTTPDIVTTGGTGFGVMAMLVAVERLFITREQALERIQKIVTFLDTECTAYHGAFAHWINGKSGTTQAFSPKDNGGDLVETAFLIQGLLTARQYFNANNAAETQLRNDITRLWENVDWNWYRKNGENVLYWHWSPDYGWEMNHKIRGWNECLITYVLAASSPTHPIDPQVYHQGWAQNGAMRNGNHYYDIALPLGEAKGGPLFFTHYSFLGLNPKNLQDQYADYWEQNRNHALINYRYCVENPKHFAGYGADCWGLTASDGNEGYNAFSPTNDQGVIAPTAALASMPYTPEESLRALRFFYYILGDKLWKEQGFRDSFNPSAAWVDPENIAIDQGPIVVMIENYRTQLIWNLFMQNKEIHSGLEKLGFK